MWHRTVDCLGVAVGITSAVPELDAALAAVLRSYADATQAPALAYRLELRDWPTLIRDGVVVGRHDTTRDLVPALELDLYAEVVARAGGLALHAGAVVGAGGLALVFAGPSGSGKSTLIRALLARGLSYLSEECVVLRPGGRCLGLARALHVDDDAIAVPAGFACDAYVVRTATGERTTRLLHPPAARIWRGEARAAAVVALAHGSDAPDTLAPLGGGAALAALWPAVFRRELHDALAATAALADVARFALHTTSPARALDHALALARELGVAAG
jgi:hypothetical protein